MTISPPLASDVLLEALNPEQQQAVRHGIDATAPGAPLLVIAGAGTGKTSTLAHRVAWLLLHGVRPERILLLTFSRRAAAEMLSRAGEVIARAEQVRVGAIATPPAQRLWSGTFHAIANRLLREYAQALNLAPNFSVLDRGDAADLMDIVRNDLDLAAARRRFPRKDTCLAIYSHRVNSGLSLKATLAAAFPWCAEWEPQLAQLCRAYVEAKQRQHLLDYDDLLLYWQLLMEEEALARDVGRRFDHVLVDEYQDTNSLQARILHALKPDGRGLCVVGDDAQSIYSFRAATVDNILNFPASFEPPASRVTLERNYRSTQPILDAANALLAQAGEGYRKSLRARSPAGQAPRYVMVGDDRAQADYVATRVLAQREDGIPLRRQAVLMRKSSDSDLLEVELTRRDIPYVKYGGLKFLEAAHIKDCLSLLRFADNPGHRLAGFRCLQLLPGIGPAVAARCLDHLQACAGTINALADAPVPAAGAGDEWRALVALLAELAAAPAWPGQMTRVRAWYEPQLERLHGNAQVRAGDLAQLEALATQHGSRESFLTELTLDPPQASGDECDRPHLDEDYLVLSTVHSAKGQEWDAVYTLSVVDGTFPNEFAADDPARLEEERRLLYVAMTRARRHLELLAPLKFYVTQQRRYGEQHVYGARSRFMTEPVLACFEQVAWPARGSGAGESPGENPGVRDAAACLPVVDAAARLRAMWKD